MSKSTVIELAYPVEWAGDLVEKIIINRPKGKAMRKMPSGDGPEVVSQMMDVLAELISKPPAFVDEMDFVDVKAALEAMKGFFSPGQAKKSSSTA